MDPVLDQEFERQYFSYVLDAAVVASAVQQPAQMQILSDADFEWWWILASRTSNLLKVLMKEAATGRDFISTSATVSTSTTFNGINIDLWAGTAAGNGAFPLAVPYIMPATRTYSLLFTDTSGSTNNVELVFSGFKLWPKPQTAPASASGTAEAAPGTTGWR